MIVVFGDERLPLISEATIISQQRGDWASHILSSPKWVSSLTVPNGLLKKDNELNSYTG